MDSCINDYDNIKLLSSWFGEISLGFFFQKMTMDELFPAISPSKTNLHYQGKNPLTCYLFIASPNQKI